MSKFGLQKMKPYPIYKPTNIDWIGEIPENWIFTKLRFVTTSVQTGSTPSTENEEYFEGGDFDWYTPADFSTESIVLSTSKRKITKLAVDQGTVRLFPKHSILLVGIGATLGKIGISNNLCSSNQQINSIQFNSNILPYFGAYFLFSNSQNIVGLANFATLPILNQSQTKEIPITVPPIGVQQAIVTYLDQKTTLIDELIAKKEKKIELLKEKRTALINHVVTKGLDLTVKYKDSGIDWIGEIPEHWEVKKLKHIASKIDEEPELPELIFAVENIESGTGKLVGLEKELEYEGSISGFKRGDTVFNKLRPYLAKVYFAEVSGGYFGELLTIRGNEKLIIDKFLFQILSSKGFLEIVNSSTEGTKMPRANWESSIKLIQVPLPPKKEQLELISFLNQNTNLIDQNISIELQKIEKLKEYRQSLISNVVTGKIRVI